MSKKEFDENLKKLDKSELKSVDGGYNIVVTPDGAILTGTFKTGGLCNQNFNNIYEAIVFAEAHLLKTGETLQNQETETLPFLP